MTETAILDPEEGGRICPECKGSGKPVRGSRWSRWTTGGRDECPRCGGEGWIDD